MAVPETAGRDIVYGLFALLLGAVSLLSWKSNALAKFRQNRIEVTPSLLKGTRVISWGLGGLLLLWGSYFLIRGLLHL